MATTRSTRSRISKTAPAKDPRASPAPSGGGTKDPRAGPAPSGGGTTVETHAHIGGNEARRRLADVDEPRSANPPEDDPRVTVRIPRRYRLQVHRADGSGTEIVEYQPGVDEMPRSHAEHAYSVANGVEIVEA